jgi:secreted Zn-dependent insulinase-like peptidase
MLLRVLDPIIEDAFFAELRTSQQIAYRLHVQRSSLLHKTGYNFTIQSTTYGATFLLQKVDEFLDHFSKNISYYVLPQRVALICQGVLAHLLEQMQQEDSQEGRAVIENKIKAIRNISLLDVVKKAQTLFSPDNKKRFAILLEAEQASNPKLLELGYRVIGKKDIF